MQRRWPAARSILMLTFLLVGLIAGVLAKMLLPGDKMEPKGCIMTTLLGVAGALAAGFIFHNVLHWNTSNHFLGAIIGATLGAMLLILIGRALVK